MRLNDPQFWQDLRFLIVYPFMFTFGFAWAVTFFIQQKRGFRSVVVANFWSAMLGFSLGMWALLGIIALWISDRTGFTVYTSFLFTLGSILPAIVLAVGISRMLMTFWRRKPE